MLQVITGRNREQSISTEQLLINIDEARDAQPMPNLNALIDDAANASGLPADTEFGATIEGKILSTGPNCSLYSTIMCVIYNVCLLMLLVLVILKWQK